MSFAQYVAKGHQQARLSMLQCAGYVLYRALVLAMYFDHGETESDPDLFRAG